MTHTLTQLLDPAHDHRALRIAAAQALDIDHQPVKRDDGRWICERCGADSTVRTSCLAPVTGPLEVLAEQLKAIVVKRDPLLTNFAAQTFRIDGKAVPFDLPTALHYAMSWWFDADGVRKCAVCLAALGKGQI